MRALPLVGLVSEELAVLGTGVRRQGDGALSADLRWTGGQYVSHDHRTLFAELSKRLVKMCLML